MIVFFVKKSPRKFVFTDIIPAFLSAKQLKVIIKPLIALISRKQLIRLISVISGLNKSLKSSSC